MRPITHAVSIDRTMKEWRLEWNAGLHVEKTKTNRLFFGTTRLFGCLFNLFISYFKNVFHTCIFIHSFHWHVLNATIPCRSQDLLPFLSVTYFFLPPFSTNSSSILPHFILLSISCSASQSCCSEIHKQCSFGNSIFFHSLYMPKSSYSI